MLTNTRHFLVQSHATRKVYQQQLQSSNQNQQHFLHHDDVTPADSKFTSTSYSNLLLPVSPKSTLRSKIQQELHPFRKFLKSHEINPKSNQLITNLTFQSSHGESSTTMHRLLHASGSHPIPTPYDPNPHGHLDQAAQLQQLDVRELPRRSSIPILFSPMHA
ncbi:hypothetical protein F511_11853 [Dorcoceras hygrometricum]|uniref:Uncharacterized protein n=1 Tax=Dorcoceras hygrometricum TaxID=472368 RepID=A0A2Z7BA77_9LAMI|nr:hypothetical protein F511_11853 [Dorcoceras hygrometricum]